MNSLLAHSKHLVPSPEDSGSDLEDCILLEDSFFGVKVDPVPNPPGVVFAEDAEDLIESFGNRHHSSSSFSHDFPDINTSAAANEVPDYIFSGSNPGWHEETQDLWFIENMEESALKEESKSKEDILEEIRSEAIELEERSSSKESSPAPSSMITVQHQEVIYIDGKPVLTIPFDNVSSQLFDGGNDQVLLDFISEAPQQSSPGGKVRFNQNGKKKGAGRWSTSRIADPKERKKAQNREAAARYRVKKMQEKETVFTQLDAEELRNMDLKKKVLDLEQEITYLKDLMQQIRSKSHS